MGSAPAYYLVNTTPPSPNGRRGVVVELRGRRALPGQRVPLTDLEAQELSPELWDLLDRNLISLRDATTGNPVDPPGTRVASQPASAAPAPIEEASPAPPPPPEPVMPIDPDRPPSVREILAYQGPIPSWRPDPAPVIPLRKAGG